MAHATGPDIGQKLMLAFAGRTPPPFINDWLSRRPAAGVTLFRGNNYESPGQIRELTATLQRAAREAGQPRLLIAADQEGGQLNTFGDGATQFAGNLALGASRDPDLARRVGQAIGRELAAMGVNVNYAPVADLNSNPANPALGTRTFGDNPRLAATLAAAMVEGLQSAGVAATLKHFPGLGEAAVDSHHQLPLIDHSREQLASIELPPFTGGIAAGARLIMTGHFAIPALSGADNLPATLSRVVMHDFVRDELGYGGVIISDALDMGAITQGAGQIIDAIAAVRAGVDLLLLTADDAVAERLYSGLNLAYDRGLIDEAGLRDSIRRILELRTWVAAQEQPDLSVVGCPAHRDLEAELARRSITLVRDDAGLLPLRLGPEARIAAIMPQPVDLTPADTSATVAPALAAAIRHHHSHVDEYVTSHAPSGTEIAALREAVAGHDLLVVGTINASMQPAQASLVRALLALGRPTVTAALRAPYDISVYPEAAVHLCTYSIHPASLDALADALFGHDTCAGQLPVRVQL